MIKRAATVLASIMLGVMHTSIMAGHFNVNLNTSTVYILYTDPGVNTIDFTLPDFGQDKFYRFTIEANHTKTNSVKASKGGFSGVTRVVANKDHLVKVSKAQGRSGQTITMTVENTSGARDTVTVTAKISQIDAFQTVDLRPQDGDGGSLPGGEPPRAYQFAATPAEIDNLKAEQALKERLAREQREREEQLRLQREREIAEMERREKLHWERVRKEKAEADRLRREEERKRAEEARLAEEERKRVAAVEQRRAEAARAEAQARKAAYNERYSKILTSRGDPVEVGSRQLSANLRELLSALDNHQQARDDRVEVDAMIKQLTEMRLTYIQHLQTFYNETLRDINDQRVEAVLKDIEENINNWEAILEENQHKLEVLQSKYAEEIQRYRAAVRARQEELARQQEEARRLEEERRRTAPAPARRPAYR